MIAAAIVLSVLLLLCFLRFGIIIEYGSNGFTAVAYIGFLKKKIYPFKQEKREKRKERDAQTEKKAGKLKQLKSQLTAICEALSRLRRKLRIKELTIYYMAAGADPAAAAMCFGAASIAYGFITALLENNFNIDDRDFRASVDFNAAEPYVYLKARLSLAVWEVFYVSINLAKAIFLRENSRVKIRKAV